jgi:hypothetical protein
VRLDHGPDLGVVVIGAARRQPEPQIRRKAQQILIAASTDPLSIAPKRAVTRLVLDDPDAVGKKAPPKSSKS